MPALRRRRFAALLTLPLLVVPALSGCGGDDDADSADNQTITVLAAASLTGSFTELGKKFEADHPGVTVKFAFDSSATLAGQAVEGAPADVLATADTGTMQDAVDGGALAGDPTTFATNVMTVAVPAGNPAGITSFADLEKDDVDFVVCVDTAPCGKTAATLLADNQITHAPVSLETDVKAVLAKVTEGEADAGLVYVTDATAAGDAVENVEIPDAASLQQEYPIGVLEQAGDADLAQAFVDLVTSADGQALLANAGFGAP